ncbi:hypothetical protein HMPREF0495_00033 [Levilactobacillus brevis ATCC 14869 = DSM 20054]|uniref:Uncharacterized protein n=1 Tax=Levilactobacillus brevis ATCC 14869 = DSM 20054 TaxID=649758 RepID=U2PR50_LEVBR|nr:hypothetical protein HMPREF0495_00033 [Levilactobacillus brevis ATCC 14869 = DSM 20054]
MKSVNWSSALEVGGFLIVQRKLSTDYKNNFKDCEQLKRCY